MSGRRRLRSLVALLGLPATAAAQLAPLGGELQLNAYTTGAQSAPALAADPLGRWIAVWESDGSTGGDSSASSVQARRFSAALAPLAGELQVNTYTPLSQRYPSVAAGADGGFVVAWQSAGAAGDASGWSVHARGFDAAGDPLGPQLQLNVYTADDQLLPAVAADAGGGFVVVWQSVGSAGDDQSGRSVQLRRASGDGSPAGAELQVNTVTEADQRRPGIAAAPGGGFVVVWESGASAGSDVGTFSVQARRFDASGDPVGPEFQVNAYTPNGQHAPAAAVAADGSFLVAWQSYGSVGDDESGFSIQARRFDAAGAPLGAQFQVNSHTPAHQKYPVVAAEPDGGFLVVWQSESSAGGDTSLNSVQARRVDAADQPLGADLQVNGYTAMQQLAPALAIDGAGRPTVAWQSRGSGGGDTSMESVQGRRLATGLFADGFETGDTSAWSGSFP
jgi:hypothetical protein